MNFLASTSRLYILNGGCSAGLGPDQAQSCALQQSRFPTFALMVLCFTMVHVSLVKSFVFPAICHLKAPSNKRSEPQLCRSLRMWALLGTTIFSGIAAALVPTTWDGRSYDCKCYVGDDCWPKAEEWSALNATLDGNLAVHIPPGAACHNTYQGPLGNISTYNQTACSNVAVNFNSAQWA